MDFINLKIYLILIKIWNNFHIYIAIISINFKKAYKFIIILHGIKYASIHIKFTY